MTKQIEETPNYIKEYVEYLHANPKSASLKVKAIYERLLKEIDEPVVENVYNEETGEYEEHKFIFDPYIGARPIRFIETFCKHSKGKWARKPIVLELWEKALIQAAYGFIDEETGLRRFNKVILFIARKNGKSTLAAALALYHLTKDGEYGAECYSVAVKKDQAKIVWDEAWKMIAKSPKLDKNTKRIITGIFYDKTESKFCALASDSNSLDGLNSSFVSCDEVHAWRDKNLMDVMYDSMSAREQPMLFMTSTMGTVRENVFDNEYEYAEKVISGVIKDVKLLPIIYELDSKEEWQDESNWKKANPALGTVKKMDALKNKVQRALNNPTELVNLLCKDFNVSMLAEDKWLKLTDVANNLTYNLEDYKGWYGVSGTDLSATTDLTSATVLLWDPIKDQKVVIQKYFIPKYKLEEKIKEDKIPYDVWSSLGYVYLCEGAKVDYKDVTRWYVELVENYNIRPLYNGYDPWNSKYWLEDMDAYGFEMEEIRQGAKTLSRPMKELEADLIEKKVNYNKNPITQWCLTNTAVKRDENDNIRPVKGRSEKARIDGAVSLIMAYAVLEEHKQDLLSLMEE